MQTCESIYLEQKEYELFDVAVDNYGRAIESNDGLALMRYNRATIQLAKLTGERLNDIRAEVIETFEMLKAMR